MVIKNCLKNSILLSFLILATFISKAQNKTDSLTSLTRFISLEGYSIKIPYSVVRTCTNFKIASGFKLRKAFIYITDAKSFSQPRQFLIKKNEFDIDLIKFLETISPGYVISVSPIVLNNPQGKDIELSGISYSVTD